MEARPSEGSGVGPDPRRAGAFRFWQAFASANENACREALQALGEIRGEEYSNLALEGSMSPESGKYLMVEMPATSPKNARDAWNSDRATSLVRVDPMLHCLSFDGEIKNYDGGEFFVACGMEHPSSIGPEACNVGTHKNVGRKRFELTGPAYVVKVKASSAATKPKVLGGCYLLEIELPSEALELNLHQMLLEFKAVPRVWRAVLEHYPGFARMVEWMGGHATVPQEPSPVDVETVDENSTAGGAPKVPDHVSVHSTSLGGSIDSFEGTARRRFQPEPAVGDNWGIGSVSSWRRRGEALSLQESGVVTQGWESALKRSEAKLRAEMISKFQSWDKSLDMSFAAGDAQVDRLRKQLRSECRDASTDASQALEKALELEEVFNKRLNALEARASGGHGGSDGLVVDTGATSGNHKLAWDDLSPVEQEKLLSSMIDHLDVERLSNMVSSKLGVTSIKEELRRDGMRLVKIEQEFASEHGTVTKLQEQMATWDARRNSTSSERGGYVFSSPQDVQALVSLAGAGKLCTLCLDLHGMLTLAQDPYVTYEAGVQVHANAIKASFGSVVESRIKMSFELPYPELLVKCIETASTAGRGGAKWAPMFGSAELFEDDFRDGSHRRVIKGIDNAFELTQKAIDHAFPLSFAGERSGDTRKIHTVLTDQNRRAYRQCIGFIESLLPFHRTLKGGSLSTEEAWDRVFVFTMEFLTSLREVRVISSDMSEEAAMIWGCFKATDLAEEYRKQKFIEHPKALAILALTSIEREGKSMALLEQRIAKQIADANKGDKILKFDTRIQTVENKLKNILAKNPELK